MTSIDYRILGQADQYNGSKRIYTAPNGSSVLIKSLIACNSTTFSDSVSVYTGSNSDISSKLETAQYLNLTPLDTSPRNLVVPSFNNFFDMNDKSIYYGEGNNAFQGVEGDSTSNRRYWVLELPFTTYYNGTAYNSVAIGGTSVALFLQGKYVPTPFIPGNNLADGGFGTYYSQLYQYNGIDYTNGNSSHADYIDFARGDRTSYGLYYKFDDQHWIVRWDGNSYSDQSGTDYSWQIEAYASDPYTIILTTDENLPQDGGDSNFWGFISGESQVLSSYNNVAIAPNVKIAITSPDATNLSPFAIITNQEVKGNQTVVFKDGYVLNSGESLYVKSGGNTSFTAFGAEIFE